MTDSLQDVVAEMRRLTDATHEHGSIDAASVREWADRLSALAAPVVSDEMVERACRAAYVVPTDFARKDMRAALEAALSPGRSGEVAGE